MKNVSQLIRRVVMPLAACLLLLCLSCKQAAPSKLEFRLGELAPAGPLTYNVVEAQWKSQLEASPTPRVPERNFLLIRVQVTNSGGSDTSIPFLKLENSTGEVFNESESGAGVDKWMGMLRRIAPAQTEDGWLLFDVPTNSYKLRISDGAFENEHVAYVNIPLNIQPDIPFTR